MVLFNSLSGCQLECIESPRPGWADKKLIIMNTEALSAGFSSKSQRKFKADIERLQKMRSHKLEMRTQDEDLESQTSAEMRNGAHLSIALAPSAKNLTTWWPFVLRKQARLTVLAAGLHQAMALSCVCFGSVLGTLCA